MRMAGAGFGVEPSETLSTKSVRNTRDLGFVRRQVAAHTPSHAQRRPIVMRLSVGHRTTRDESFVTIPVTIAVTDESTLIAPGDS